MTDILCPNTGLLQDRQHPKARQFRADMFATRVPFRLPNSQDFPESEFKKLEPLGSMMIA
jgi:hypothetical protein